MLHGYPGFRRAMIPSVATSETDGGELVLHWSDRLAQCSEPCPGVTRRLPLTSQHRPALAVLTDLFHQAGLTVRLDAAGTLIGRLKGPEAALL